MNAPKNERVTYRRVTTCAPLDLKDLTKIESQVDPNLGTLEDVESIYAGPVNYGYTPVNLTAPSYSRNLRSAVARNGYGLEFVFRIPHMINKTNGFQSYVFSSGSYMVLLESNSRFESDRRRRHNLLSYNQ